MRIVVTDSSALIDLHQGEILDVFLNLPFEFVIPDALLEQELLSFSKAELSILRKRMEVASLYPFAKVFSVKITLLETGIIGAR